MKILHVSGIDLTILKFRIDLIEAQRKHFDAEIYVACAATGYVEELESRGYKVCVLDVSRGNPLAFKNILSIFKVRRFIKQNEIDLVHTHTPIGGFIGRVAALLAGVKRIVYTTGGFYFNENSQWLKKLLFINAERLLAKITDVIFSVNQEDIETAVRLKITPKHKMVYSGGAGVDSSIFDPSKPQLIQQAQKNRDDLEIPDTSKIVLFLGRLVVEKGIHDFLQVAARIAEEKEDVRFVVVGPGDLDEQSLNIIEQSATLQQRTSLLGMRDDVAALLLMSDVLLFPSYREGMPVSTLEAMAMQTPVVAYDIRGCREEIEQGYNGYIGPLKDQGFLYQHTLKLLESDELRQTMGGNARSFVQQEFERTIVVQRQLDAYKEIL